MMHIDDRLVLPALIDLVSDIVTLTEGMVMMYPLIWEEHDATKIYDDIMLYCHLRLYTYIRRGEAQDELPIGRRRRLYTRYV